MSVDLGRARKGDYQRTGEGSMFQINALYLEVECYSTVMIVFCLCPERQIQEFALEDSVCTVLKVRI